MEGQRGRTKDSNKSNKMIELHTLYNHSGGDARITSVL